MVWADGETSQNRIGRDLHVPFKLNSAGETIALFGTDGVLIDAVEVGEQVRDKSMGRDPLNPAGPYRVMNPTPLGENEGSVSTLRLLGRFEGPGTHHLEWVSIPGKSYEIQCSFSASNFVWEKVGEVQATLESTEFEIAS